MRRIAIAGILCACSTPYQSGGLRGGVTARLVDVSTYVISARVNGYTSRSTAIEYTYRKAAEVCPTGYDVVDSESDASTSYYRIGNNVNEVKKPEQTLVIRCHATRRVIGPPGSDR